ncbi:hypothetical protein OQA88_11598 [Cercophora sp. LCS_1]
MKFITAFISLAALAAAAPSSNPNSDLISVKLEAKDAIKPTEHSNEKRTGTHWEATLQVWLGSSVCSPEPSYTWYPVSYALNADPNSAACYSHWENGVLKNVKSTMLTGPWGSNCILVAYAGTGCSATGFGADGARQAGPYGCITLPNNTPIKSMVVRCIES